MVTCDRVGLKVLDACALIMFRNLETILVSGTKKIVRKSDAASLDCQRPIFGYTEQEVESQCWAPYFHFVLRLFSGLKQTNKQTKQTPWPEPASELYRPNDRRLSAK
jgi:hypothetical protein